MDSSKCFLILFFVCCNISYGSPALTMAGVAQTKKMMKNLCMRSSGVSQSTLNQLKTGVFPEDEKLKCYIHCVLGMMKTMKKDKITVPEATKQIQTLLPEEMREASLKQLNSCKDAVGANACDKGFNFAKCCFEVEPNNMLIPT